MANQELKQGYTSTETEHVDNNGTAGANSATDTTLFNPNLNLPGNNSAPPATPTQKPAETAPSEVYAATGYFRQALANSLVQKTYYTEFNDVINTSYLLEFAKKVFPESMELIEGKQKEYPILLPMRGHKFSLEAFNRSAENGLWSITTPAGTHDTKRSDIHNAIKANMIIRLVDNNGASVETNKILKIRDVYEAQYTDVLKSGKINEFINKTVGELVRDMEIDLINRRVFGYQAYVDGVLRNQNGLYQVIGSAYQDTVSNIYDSSYLTRKIEYKPAIGALPSKQEALAQLDEVLFKMKNTNTTFGFSNKTQDGTSANNGLPCLLKNPVLIMSKKLESAIKVADLDYFKSLKEYFPNIEIAVIPDTTFDTAFNSTSQQATIQSINLNLANGWVAIVDKASWVYMSNEPVKAYPVYSENNQTMSSYITAIPTLDYLPNGSVCLFDLSIFIGGNGYDVISRNP